MQGSCCFRDAVLTQSRDASINSLEDTRSLEGRDISSEDAALTLLTRRDFGLAEEARPLEGRGFF